MLRDPDWSTLATIGAADCALLLLHTTNIRSPMRAGRLLGSSFNDLNTESTLVPWCGQGASCLTASTEDEDMFVERAERAICASNANKTASNS